mgnify:FL=1
MATAPIANVRAHHAARSRPHLRTRLAGIPGFYRDTLGIALVHDGSAHGFCQVESGGLQVILEPIASGAPDEEQALVGRFLGLSFAVKDLHAEHARLIARGVQFTGLPEAQAWGGMLATLQDPSGNRPQLVQYPAGGS